VQRLLWCKSPNPHDGNDCERTIRECVKQQVFIIIIIIICNTLKF
jgi:hypothetical protein